ncbi:putative gamma-tubulin complex subunit [Trypanosoma rangeli]|uniref:Spindle pole body component n=1 Tax=Trypanosoma rangeli TaxID=5698 RepID=A0A3R7RTV6_TRYRA|nr:putative gamma-tubulin complex subunit [Trypanosoma rangeli]RNF12861.1 putative gamma-tubulin complex subunit [Trypanosoma rangeli]|eukprot:RNF12861.1 putative gamma-tubulin complex subunit [Trypanosoma rangeli]
MPTHLWANFVTSLESRSVSFQQVQHATDRRAVIVEAGFTDPISIAILETEWLKRCTDSASSSVAAATAANKAVGVAAPVAAASTLSYPHFEDYTKLEDVPEEIQDRVVTADVLAAVVGHGGSLLQASRDGFVVSRYVPVSMRSLCKTIIPVADAFVALHRMERAEYMGKSLVAMALGEVVSEVCTSFAHEMANLQRWTQGRAMPLMGVVSEVMRAGHHIVRLRQLLPTDTIIDEEGTLSMAGWRLLNHLHEQSEKCSGSREDDELLILLLRRALMPYLRVLHRWMHEGLLEDPYGEFFISEAQPLPGTTSTSTTLTVSSPNGTRNMVSRIFPNYTATDDCGGAVSEEAIAFERRFSINRNMIPNFLLKPSKIAKMVFYAGKYCCLLREYNGTLPAFGDVAEHMLVWSGNDKLHRKIEESYEISSGEVLRLFLGSQVDLLGHLTSLKSYFLHQRGDWLVDFLDSAEELLVKSPVQVKVHSLRVLLQAAIARCCGTDPYHSIIGCSFSDSTIEQYVNGSFEHNTDEVVPRGSCGRRSAMRIETHRCIELLQLEAYLKWPLTMVLDAAVLRRLNVVFRLFTCLKICERNLTTAWTDVDVPHQSFQAYSIKHQLIQFIRQFQFYAAHFVVEPLWGRMMGRIGQADSVFAVNNALQDFFEGVELGLVLASSHRFRSLSRILEIASSFTEMGRREVSSQLSAEQVRETLKGAEERFLKALSELASPVGTDYPQLIPLLTWIDFSGFYDRNGVYRVLYSAGISAETMSTVSTDRHRR